ncbi:MAG: lipopolysaccharide biosynthesis protein [Candidatus Thorarchaeota archaeon]
MERTKFTLSQLVSLSLGMSFFFGFAQVTGYAARILFRATLGPEHYGVFAFLINLFIFYQGLNGLSLNVPIVARVSENPSDNAFYSDFISQVFSISFISGLLLSATFFFYASSVTELDLVLYLAAMILLSSTGQIMHCFPRGRERFKPTAVSLVLVGLGRILLLLLFIFLGLTNLPFAMLVYTLPYLGWWVIYLYYEGRPSLSRPRLKFLLSVYTDAFVSYLIPLSVQIPILLGIILLTGFHGFGVAGDFDIALIPYYALASLIVGISFVTISKARKLPDFRSTIKKMVPSLIIPMFFLSAIVIIAAFLFDFPIRLLLATLGLPVSTYWPVVLLISIGIPTNVLVSVLVSYFQGLGEIRQIAAVVVLCALGLIPLQVVLAYSLSFEGAMLSVVLANIVVALVLLGYGHNAIKVTNAPERK